MNGRVVFALVFCTIGVLITAATPSLLELLGASTPDGIQVFLFGMLVGGSVVYVADP